MGQVTQRALHKQEKEAREAGKASFFLAWVSDVMSDVVSCPAAPQQPRSFSATFASAAMRSYVSHAKTPCYTTHALLPRLVFLCLFFSRMENTAA